MASERDMLDLLVERYTALRRGTTADRWIRAEHVKQNLDYSDGQRIADFIAVDKYMSTLAMHGQEVKVSRADWLTELRDPAKAEAIKRYMHHWHLVVPDADIVKPGELPNGWGLMAISAGKLRIKHRAPRLDPEPAPLDFTVSLMSASRYRTSHREHRYRTRLWRAW
jgi:hypothetical protein